MDYQSGGSKVEMGGTKGIGSGSVGGVFGRGVVEMGLESGLGKEKLGEGEMGRMCLVEGG